MNRRDGEGRNREERCRERSRSRDDDDQPAPEPTPTSTEVASETGPGVAGGNGDSGEHLPEAAASSSSGIGAAARTLRNQQTADVDQFIPAEEGPQELIHTPPAEVVSQARLRRERDAAAAARAMTRASHGEPGGEDEDPQRRDRENLEARWHELDRAVNRGRGSRDEHTEDERAAQDELSEAVKATKRYGGSRSTEENRSDTKGNTGRGKKNQSGRAITTGCVRGIQFEPTNIDKRRR